MQVPTQWKKCTCESTSPLKSSQCYLLQKKKSALFEVAEVIPVMTNNYEDSILKGVKVKINVCLC